MGRAEDGFLGRLDPDMCVVTAAAGGERAGCLVGFASQCSIRPPRFTVWLSTANHTCRVARAAHCLAVHYAGMVGLYFLARALWGTDDDQAVPEVDVDTVRPEASA